ncbi:MAG: hypothetical protein RRC07_02240 [Anaerolineae bacterium]|nr:hypothetical protein [Anaerolineae bacterium]
MHSFAFLWTVLVIYLGLFAGCTQERQAPGAATARPTALAAPLSSLPATTTARPGPAASPAPLPTPTLEPVATNAAPRTPGPAQPGTLQGFELVGHHALGSIGWHAGLALYDRCAYVGNRRSGGVTIVDITDPAAPAVTGSLPFGAEGQPVELRVLPARAVLVAADFAQARLLTFDVSDCAAPQPLGAIELPGAPHEFYLWSDGEQILVFGAMFDHAPADLMVIDVADPRQPRLIAEWRSENDGVAGLLHSLSVSADGSRAYLALWNGGVLVAEVDLLHIRVLRDSNGAAHPIPFAAAHSAVPLGDDNAPAHLFITSELWRCPFGAAAIVSVVEPAQPYIVATLEIPENRCEELPVADAVFSAHNPLVVADLVFVSWYSGGLQVFDASDPLRPERVAQFVPAGEGAAPASYIGSYPVQTWSYPILRDGLLYVVDIQSGLYVLRYLGPGSEVVAKVGHAEGNVSVLP